MRLQIGLLDMRGMRRLVNYFERKVRKSDIACSGSLSLSLYCDIGHMTL
jgi:hypothetical protein